MKRKQSKTKNKSLPTAPVANKTNRLLATENEIRFFLSDKPYAVVVLPHEVSNSQEFVFGIGQLSKQVNK